jgi:hypothetical protein
MGLCFITYLRDVGLQFWEAQTQTKGKSNDIFFFFIMCSQLQLICKYKYDVDVHGCVFVMEEATLVISDTSYWLAA